MIGVEYDLFWTLNPKTLKPFIRAFELKCDHEDRISWQQGLYIRMAIASSLSESNKYPKKPIFQSGVEMVSKEDEIKNKLLYRMEVINSRFERS